MSTSNSTINTPSTRPSDSDITNLTMSVFRADASFLGNADFKIVDIDAQQVAQGLQAYLERGSKLTGVSLDDIDLTVSELPTDAKKVTLVDLIDKGMKLFDAIVWLSAGRPTTHPLKKDPIKTVDTIPSLHQIARSVFYTYFFLLTQARYPVTSAPEGQPAVANFLRAILGMGENQSVYIRQICSFDAQKFDPSWIKFVNFGRFGQEAMSRFGLGVAGYRMFGPFKVYSPKSDISDELKTAVAFARRIATSEPSWDVHPLTRKPEVLTKRGNLNKNLGNLILEVFTEEQIAEMLAVKMLYKKPDKEPMYKNYLTWKDEDDISGTNKIFRD